MRLLLLIFGILPAFLSWWTTEPPTDTIASHDTVCACDRQRDSLVLVALYNSAGGENWVTTWNLNAPMEEWLGVRLGGDGCVVAIYLSNVSS